MAPETKARLRITEEEFENHDCHASPEDGCETCEMWFSQRVDERIEAVCPEGICDGSGFYEEAVAVDDSRVRECPCRAEARFADFTGASEGDR